MGWMLFGPLLFLALIALLVWAIVAGRPGSRASSDRFPEDTLKQRYARGEVDRDEYQRRLSDLRR